MNELVKSDTACSDTFKRILSVIKPSGTPHKERKYGQIKVLPPCI